MDDLVTVTQRPMGAVWCSTVRPIFQHRALWALLCWMWADIEYAPTRHFWRVTQRPMGAVWRVFLYHSIGPLPTVSALWALCWKMTAKRPMGALML